MAEGKEFDVSGWGPSCVVASVTGHPTLSIPVQARAAGGQWSEVAVREGEEGAGRLAARRQQKAANEVVRCTGFSAPAAQSGC